MKTFNPQLSTLLTLCLSSLVVFSAPFAGAPFPAAAPNAAPLKAVTLEWDYATNDLRTNLTFKLYHSTDISAPLETWLLLTNLVGTNVTVTIDVQPGVHFFAMTASNLWGESDFSNIVDTPSVPRTSTTLSIRRAQ